MASAMITEVAAVCDANPARLEAIGAERLGQQQVDLVDAQRADRPLGLEDERAVPFDDRIGQALEAGDPQALSALDPALAADLLVQGRAALAVLGAVVAADGGRPKPSVLYRDDGSVRGVVAGVMGIARDGSRKPDYQPGSPDVRAERGEQDSGKGTSEGWRHRCR